MHLEGTWGWLVSRSSLLRAPVLPWEGGRCRDTQQPFTTAQRLQSCYFKMFIFLTEETVPVYLEIHTKTSFFFCIQLLIIEMHHVIVDRSMITNVCVCVCVCVLVTQLCPTLCDPMDSSLPDSSIHGILQARILEWVAIPFSRGSSRPRDIFQVS